MDKLIRVWEVYIERPLLIGIALWLIVQIVAIIVG